jgi:hypothetical protein
LRLIAVACGHERFAALDFFRVIAQTARMTVDGLVWVPAKSIFSTRARLLHLLRRTRWIDG